MGSEENKVLQTDLARKEGVRCASLSNCPIPLSQINFLTQPSHKLEKQPHKNYKVESGTAGNMKLDIGFHLPSASICSASV